ncbi:MAG: hypothetical protein ACO273_00515 [Burkholderiales bacterium]
MKTNLGLKWMRMLQWACALWLSVAAMFAAAAEAPVDPDRRVETVTLDNGEISRTFQGTLRGREYIDFQIAAGAGQRLGVTLKRGNAMNYFKNMAPGANEALLIGSTSGHQARRILAADGVYTIRLYLMRAAARRNEHSDYELNIALDGKSLLPLSPTKDALVLGTPYHATATISCQRGEALPARCDANVICCGQGGTGTVVVVWPGGFKRNLLFVKLQPMASDSREAMTYTREGDVTAVSLGKEERFEIPDALVAGG